VVPGAGTVHLGLIYLYALQRHVQCSTVLYRTTGSFLEQGITGLIT